MKIRVLNLILVVVLLLSLTSCGEQVQTDSLKRQISELKDQKLELGNEIIGLEKIISEKKEESGTANTF